MEEFHGRHRSRRTITWKIAQVEAGAGNLTHPAVDPVDDRLATETGGEGRSLEGGSRSKFRRAEMST